MEETLDWDYIYLLGWYDANGRSHLTTWEGDLPPIDVVVIKRHPLHGPPLWAEPIPAGCKALHIPDTIDTFQGKIDYALSLGGVYAFGWRTSKPVDRGQKENETTNYQS